MESFKWLLIFILFVSFMSEIINELPKIPPIPCNSNAESKEKCHGTEPMPDLPLIQGRCCWKDTASKCSFQKPEVVTKIEQLKQEYSCGTNVEVCYSRTSVPSKAYEYCYTLHTEIPFKCCYIRVGPKSFCYPLDVSNNDIYAIFESKLRAKHNYDDPYVEIFCEASLLNTSLFFLILSLFFL